MGDYKPSLLERMMHWLTGKLYDICFAYCVHVCDPTASPDEFMLCDRAHPCYEEAQAAELPAEPSHAL